MFPFAQLRDQISLSLSRVVKRMLFDPLLTATSFRGDEFADACAVILNLSALSRLAEISLGAPEGFEN